MPKYQCPKCGTLFTEAPHFCPVCGVEFYTPAPVVKKEEVKPTEIQKEEPKKEQAPQQEQKASNGRLNPKFIVALALIVGFGLPALSFAVYDIFLIAVENVLLRLIFGAVASLVALAIGIVGAALSKYHEGERLKPMSIIDKILGIILTAVGALLLLVWLAALICYLISPMIVDAGGPDIAQYIEDFLLTLQIV